MGDLIQGRRVEENIAPHLLKPGEYSKVTDEKNWGGWPGKPYWNLRTPNGIAGALVDHEVTENEDNTITVSPSILVTGEREWHGYLERGVWREC